MKCFQVAVLFPVGYQWLTYFDFSEYPRDWYFEHQGCANAKPARFTRKQADLIVQQVKKSYGTEAIRKRV